MREQFISRQGRVPPMVIQPNAGNKGRFLRGYITGIHGKVAAEHSSHMLQILFTVLSGEKMGEWESWHMGSAASKATQRRPHEASEAYYTFLKSNHTFKCIIFLEITLIPANSTPKWIILV